jgi:phospholipase/lecithinase/hemolysin
MRGLTQGSWVLLILWVAALSIGGAAASNRSPIRSVVTFGDSWSDAGSFGTIYGTTPGSSWSQLLARTYGDDQTAYLFAAEGKPIRILGGLNYAQGGSKTATPAKAGAAEDSIPHSAAVQIQNHLKTHKQLRADQLVILWTGCNDILRPFRDDSSAELTPEQIILSSDQGASSAPYASAEKSIRQAVSDEVNLVQLLLSSGARRIAVINIVDRGCQPNTTPAGVKSASRLTTIYNESLATQLPRDSRVLLIDADAILERAAEDHSAAGFRHVAEDACGNKAAVCGPADYVEPDASRSYMFAGFGHLTEHTRRLLANSVAQAVDARWSGNSRH